MKTDWPKLRSDLLVSRQEREGQVSFMVKDPVDDQFFRLKEEEYFIAAQLDGQTPLETVRQRAEEKFHVSLNPEALGQFVATLRKTKLLESGGHARSRRHKRGRLRGSLLYLRFKLCDPDALLGGLQPAFRSCFTPAFVAFTMAVIVWALLLGIANWTRLFPELAALLRWESLPWLWAAMLVVSTLHEFAHGLTCKHFGGRVRELGFLLAYLLPAFYCNVSDAWMFPEKRKRLWVGFAGPYFELFAWACAVLAWRVVESDTWLSTAALSVLATSGIKTLVNFNPLIKLDGYYLLSDLLEVPNLRRRAFRYVGDGIKRIAGLGETEAVEIPRRERRIYVTYGLLAAVFSFSLLAFALVQLGGFMLASEYPEVLALAGLLLGVRLRNRVHRLFGGASDPSDPEDFSVSENPSEPNRGREEPKPGRHKPRRRKFPARLVTILVLCAAAVPLMYFGRMELRVSGPFSVLPIENADVRPEVGGTVEEVYVDEGDFVHAGKVIARLSDRENRNELSRTEAEIAQTQARLRLLEAGPRREEIELAQIAVVRAEDRARLVLKNLERDRELVKSQLLAQKDFEASQFALSDSTNEVAEAKKRLEILQAGTRPEEIEAMKAGLARLETQRRYLEEQLRFAKVASPAAGIVATPSHELEELAGKVVQAGDLIAKVDDLSSVEVQTPISEKDIADVQVGQQVVLKARAYPDKTFFGKVTSVGTTVQGAAGEGSSSHGASGSARSSSRPPQASTVLVTTRIANDDLLLKPGMTGKLKISCGKRRVLDLALRRIARTIKVEFWSWW